MTVTVTVSWGSSHHAVARGPWIPGDPLQDRCVSSLNVVQQGLSTAELGKNPLAHGMLACVSVLQHTLKTVARPGPPIMENKSPHTERMGRTKRTCRTLRTLDLLPCEYIGSDHR